MGFGFFGKYGVSVNFQGGGNASSAVVGLGLNGYLSQSSSIFYLEYLTTNTGTLPSQQRLIATTPVTYNPNNNTSIPVTNQTAIAVANAAQGEFFYNTQDRRYIWASAAALNTNLRTFALKVPRPDNIAQFYAGITQGNIDGVFNIPFFINMTEISFSVQRLTELRGRWPENLRKIAIDMTTLTTLTSIQRNFPRLLTHLFMTGVGSGVMTNFNNLIQDCNNLEVLILQRINNAGATASACIFPANTTLELSHMTSLRCLAFTSANIVNINHSITTLQDLSIPGCTALANAQPTKLQALVNAWLAASNNRYLNIVGCNLLWTKSFVDSDFKSTIREIFVDGNRITGSFTLTTQRTNLLSLRLGNNISVLTAANKNNFQTVNVSGATNVTTLDLSNSQIENLTLPPTVSATILYLGGNKLNVVTQPSLVNQILALSTVTQLFLNSGGSTAAISVNAGQDSVNGFGSDLNLSTRSYTTFSAVSCKLSGTLKLRTTAVTVNIAGNNVVSLENEGSVGSNFNSLLVLNVDTNTGFNFSYSRVPNIRTITGSRTAQVVANFSGRTTTNRFEGFSFVACPNLTTVVLPSNSANCVFGSAQTFAIQTNPLLTQILNLDKVSYDANTGNRLALFNGNAINQHIPVGEGNFNPTQLSLATNQMSVANLDSTITSLYTNRTKWSLVVGAKSFNISGTGNGVPTGTYQAPSGFVLGSNDGTPASPKEMVYVLVNNYAWTITMN